MLVINPNSDLACSAGIDAAIAPFRLPGGPTFTVRTLPDGPPAIYSWRDWHAVVEPLCGLVEHESADLYMIACASDPGIEAVRATTTRPVLGVFRCAVAAAMAQAGRFGVIALVDASKARHLATLHAISAADALAGEIALNVSMTTLLDPAAARTALIAAGRKLVAAGAGAIVLGCTGMAHHRDAVEQAIGVPVIDPCQAAAAQALGVLLGVA